MSAKPTSASPGTGDRMARLTSGRALVLAAVVVTALIATILCLALPDLSRSLGDSDDALRLVLVRDLLHGRGWWDQHVDRLQPPIGVWMQWSRLIDGGLALTDWTFSLILGPAEGERLARIVWPLLWIFPAVAASLFAARSLASPSVRGAAVIVCASALVAAPYVIFHQFTPGRIDHHGPQIALCLVAAAGAIERRRIQTAALVAGAATGLGLAIGLEALVPDAVIGAWIATRFLRFPDQGRAVIAYAGALAVSLTGAFLFQTPPSRWGLSFCDGLGLNLVLGVCVACAAVSAAVMFTAPRGIAARSVALGIGAALALGVFLAAKPVCIAGPFAEIDPRIRTVWLDHVIEVQSLAALAASDLRTFIAMVTPQAIGVCAVLSLAWLRRREGAVDAGTLFWAGLMLLSVLLASAAVRMGFYGLWLAPPAIGAFGAELLRRWKRLEPVYGVGLGVAFSGSILSGALAALAGLFLAHAHPAQAAADHCSEAPAYAVLARLPPGLTVAEVDLGGFIVAATPSSALASPYHRAAWGMLQATSALSSPEESARKRLGALGATYVLDCPAHAYKWTPWPAESLQRRLDRGQPPPWLQPLSQPHDAIAVYKVLR